MAYHPKDIWYEVRSYYSGANYYCGLRHYSRARSYTSVEGFGSRHNYYRPSSKKESTAKSGRVGLDRSNGWVWCCARPLACFRVTGRAVGEFGWTSHNHRSWTAKGLQSSFSKKGF